MIPKIDTLKCMDAQPILVSLKHLPHGSKITIEANATADYFIKNTLTMLISSTDQTLKVL